MLRIIRATEVQYRRRCIHLLGQSRFVVAASVLSTVLGVAPLDAYGQSTLDTARNRGIAWLIANQKGDGNWGGSGNETAATSLAADALRRASLPPSSYPYAAALAWLGNSHSASVDSLARRTRSLITGGSTAYVATATLLASRNYRWAWGAYAGYETSYPDTPLALSALRISAFGAQLEQDLRNAVYCSTLPGQRSDGGWGYARSAVGNALPFSASAVLPTAVVLSELHALRNSYNPAWDSGTCPNLPSSPPSSIVASIANGRSFLATRKKADGGYGDGPSSGVTDTAVVYDALRTIDSGHADTAAALDYLLSKQLPAAGNTPASWGNEDPFATALVLSVLPPPSTTLADTDQDGIPDAIEVVLGRNPNVPDSRYLAIGGGNTTPGLTAQAYTSWRKKYKVPGTIVVQANGGVLPRTWSKTSGSLPSGISLNPNTGELAGTPNSFGKHVVTLTVADATGTAVNVQVEITVSSAMFTKRDFGADFRSDVLWRNQASGENYLYPMNGTTILASEGYIRTVSDLAWQVAGMGDFDGDGRADILWRNTSNGENYIYFMNGITIPTEGAIRTVADLDWGVVGVGDFNGDGKDDILWRNATTGENYVYIMDGLSIVGEGYLRTVADLNWNVVGIGDFDGDGNADVLWRNSSTGENYLYPMDGTAIKATEGYIRTVSDSAWQVKGVGDFDGDGKSDVLWRNSTTGENYIYPMNGTQILASEGYTRTVADADWRIVDIGDYGSDGKADVLWRNASTGENYLWPMNGLEILAGEGYLRTVADLNWNVINK